MRPNAPTRRLRGADPLTVEVEVPGLVNRPFGQVAPGTLADLLSLSEMDGLPPGIAVRLRGYPERVERAVADIPSGAPFAEWLSGIEALEAANVPSRLRTIIEAEAGRRGGLDATAAEPLVASWSEVDPAEFAYGEARVQARQVREGSRRVEAVRGKQARPASERPKSARAPRPRKEATPANPQQDAWIRQMVMERLRATAGAGLLEPVLLAALKHRSRDRFPNLSDHELRAALRSMASSGDIKLSARRWKLL